MRRVVAHVAAVGVLLAGGLVACAGRARPDATASPNGAVNVLSNGDALAVAGPIDARATPETRALFTNLRRLAGRGVMFGHQESLAYGFTWVAEPGRSDVHDVTGSYPAVYGWDVSTLFAHGPRDPGGTARVDRMRGWIAEGYGRGGVITMSWHLGNPVTGGDAWDTTSAVAELLPGGSTHAVYRAKLDTVAAFFRTLRARDRSGRETLVPVVFRPFHEMSGGWFWWGRRHATRADYVALWRYTVGYLRDSAGVHNLLYAYSPDVFASQADYLDRYPGDGYVDVLGFDDYQSVRSPALRDTLVRRLHDVVALADARGKVAALTETGLEAIPDSLWWTHTLLPALTADSITRRVMWALVWRNANNEHDRHNHFFAAYRGQASAADFVRFRDDPFVLFEDELPDLYHVAAASRVGAAAPIDTRATAETRALFTNLRGLAGRRILFGHHDDLAYGHTWAYEPGRSDVKEAGGAYPAVFEWDLSNIERDSAANIDRVPFARIRGWIVDRYARGAVNVLSWHVNNPVSGGNAWDTTAAVAAVLPGGARHADYVRWLDRVAAFASSLRAPGPNGGTLVPVVFRPFHEASGSWFWWGGQHATPDQYRQLWQFTVQYLRDHKGVHNLLYAYSPDVFASESDYLVRYPGDAYVDVLGYDDYQSVRSPATRPQMTERMRTVARLAGERGKIAALTETGVEAVPDSLWWTGTLLPALRADSLTRQLAWVSVWRNAPQSVEHPHHFFAPYAGQASAADFARFRGDPLIAFDGDVPDLYRTPR